MALTTNQILYCFMFNSRHHTFSTRDLKEHKGGLHVQRSHARDLRTFRAYWGNMENQNNAISRRDNGGYDSADQPIQFDYEITIVGGERGRRLAIEQANSILEVLEWFSRHAPPPTHTP